VFNLTGQLMSDMTLSHRFGPPLLAALLAAGPVQAQIVTDGTVGPKVSLQGGQIEIGSDLGTQSGANLFHSFEKFGIATGQTATFTGPGDIKNVISRVTGGETSNIDGTLASQVGQADFYFLNPAGVIFGPNAQLNVPGSFHVSTAHELRFADGARFSALDKTGSGLTVAPPEAFGFLDNPPNRITVDQSQLKLQPGKTLSLVGGDLTINGGQSGTLMTADGVVQLVSAAAPGAVRIADAAAMVGQRGEVHVTQAGDRATQGSMLGSVDVTGQDGGGTIRIRGGRVVTDGAWIFADNSGSQNSTGGIDVQSDSLVMRGGYLTTDVYGAGRGGTITIETKDFQLHDGATMRSNSHPGGTGSSGTITIQTDHLLMVGGNEDTQITANTSTTGNAGDIAITAKSLELQPGGWIRSEAVERSSGSSGTITIQTDDLLAFGTNSDPAGIETRNNSAGQGGRTVIMPKEREGKIVLRGNVQINSNTYGSGGGGDITIDANHLDASSDSTRAQISISTSTGGAGGPAGRVNLNVNELVLRGNVQISSDTGGSGAAGTVTIQTRSMSLTNDAQVRVKSEGSNVIGVGGSITIKAAEALSLDHAAIEANTTTAEGGDVTLAIGRLFYLNNSTLTTSVAGGKGSGGNILINSPLMVFDHSKIIANAIGGSGGNITIQAGQLIRTPNNVVTASGDVAGNITIAAPNTDVSSSLVVLPETFFDVSSQLREACAARGGRRASSLTVGGRGGLPPDPGTPLAAGSFGQPLKQQTAAGSPTTLTPRPLQTAKTITVTGIPQPVLGSPRLTCRR
jgi:filamentous hemagglutinin family protein